MLTEKKSNKKRIKADFLFVCFDVVNHSTFYFINSVIYKHNTIVSKLILLIEYDLSFLDFYPRINKTSNMSSDNGIVIEE
jgi:hypothetical protein